MSIGGSAWDGWTFGPWGKARDWRLTAPDGTSYMACEIAELRRAILDLDYLQVRVRELEQLTAPGSVSFAPSDAATLRAAAAIIERAMPRLANRRAAYLVPIQTALLSGR